MDSDAFYSLAIALSFLLVAVLTLINLSRHRDSARLDIALPFAALAIIFIAQVLQDVFGIVLSGISAVTTVMFMALPYLFVRLLKHFRSVPKTIERLTIAGIFLSLVTMIPFAPPMQTWAGLALIVYFVVAQGYSILAFVRGAFLTRGVTRYQLLLVAIGSGLFVSILLLVVLGALIQTTVDVVLTIARVIAILSAFCYYLGFASPRWLRLIWQRAELHHFLKGGDQLVKIEQQIDAIIYLCRFAVQAVGGQAAIVGLWDQPSHQLVIAEQDAQLAGTPLRVDHKDVIGNAWRNQKPIASVKRAEFGDECGKRAAVLESGALYAIPISYAGQAVGMLIVFLRGTLFPEDDVEMLTLFAGQEARAFRLLDLIGKVSDLNKHLIERAEELEAVNKELEAFSYSVSHDLRSPLRAIDGFSRILEEDYSKSLPDEAVRYLGLIRGGAQQMGHLIDDLLSFSRLGRQALKTETVEPSEIAQQVLDELADQQNGRKIDVTISEMPASEGDPSLLKQVFVNLLANALKFTGQRDLAKIEVGFKEAEGNHIYFVKDNGAGFDMKYADKLFGVFQRLHRVDEFEGTGVGLATVQRIIHKHGGRIWVEAAVDQGATFYFTLKGNDSHGA